MPIGNTTNAQPFDSQVTGLLPWITYHYRAVATNGLGRTDGPDMDFTLPGPSVITPSVWGLHDLTIPQGGSTTVGFNVTPAQSDVGCVPTTRSSCP